MSHNSTPANPESTLKPVVEASAFLIALCSIWLYLAGWTYAYHYFDRFRIPLLMVELPLEHYFVYGFIVIRQQVGWVIAISLATLALALFWNRLPAPIRQHKIALAAVLILIGFWLGHAAGVSTAHAQFQQQRTSDYAAYPRVQIWRTAEAAKNPNSAPSAEELAKGCYRLLLHNQDRLFLFRPFQGAPAAGLATVILPWNEIASVRVLPDYTSCP